MSHYYVYVKPFEFILRYHWFLNHIKLFSKYIQLVTWFWPSSITQKINRKNSITQFVLSVMGFQFKISDKLIDTYFLYIIDFSLKLLMWEFIFTHFDTKISYQLIKLIDFSLKLMMWKFIFTHFDTKISYHSILT